MDDAPKIASSKECIAVTNGAPHWSSSESELFGNWCIALPRRSTKSEDCEMHTSSSAATSSNNRTRTLPLSRKRARMRDAGRRSPEMDRAEPQHAEDGSVEADSQRTSRGATTIGKRKASAAKPHREPKQRIRTSQLRKVSSDTTPFAWIGRSFLTGRETAHGCRFCLCRKKSSSCRRKPSSWRQSCVSSSTALESPMNQVWTSNCSRVCCCEKHCETSNS